MERRANGDEEDREPLIPAPAVSFADKDGVNAATPPQRNNGARGGGGSRSHRRNNSGQQLVYFFSPSDRGEEETLASSSSSDFSPVQEREQYSWYMLCFFSWCPCFVGRTCSPERREEYSKATRSFSFLISVVDIIMLIVGVALPPHLESVRKNWAVGPPAVTFVELGAFLGCKVRYHHQFWRFLTPMYLHSGIIHLLFNILCQLRIGVYVEHKWGWMKLVSIYFLGGISGALCGGIVRSDSVSVGATAALMGVIGAYLAEIIAHWERTEENQRKMALLQVLSIIFLAMMLGFFAYIDTSLYSSNVGGLVFGILAGLSYFGSEFSSERARRLVPISCFVVIVALLTGGRK